MTTSLAGLSSLDTPGVDPHALLFTEARTANTFADTPIGDDELRRIWDLTRFAPTMANSQPLRLLWVRTPGAKERLLPHVNEANRLKTAATPVTAVLAFDLDFHEHFPTVFPDRGPAYRDNFGAMAPEQRADMAKYSAALATGVFFLAVRALGLAAGPMAGFDADGVDAEFFADSTWRTHLLVNVGHPGTDPWFPRLPRIDVDTAVAWA